MQHNFVCAIDLSYFKIPIVHVKPNFVLFRENRHNYGKKYSRYQNIKIPINNYTGICIIIDVSRDPRPKS